MAGSKNIKEFPDLSSKLAAPTKKSLFERQKADAEAKRAREEAETAAVYEDFVKSFENQSRDSGAASGSNGRPALGSGMEAPGPRMPGGPPKRHFTSAGRNSGPGSLGPPPNVSRKRTHDGSRVQDRDKEKGIFAFEDSPPPGALGPAGALRTSDDEEETSKDSKEDERAAPKPTLQLSSLPPGTSPAVIKNLIPPPLIVDGVRILPPTAANAASSGERKSTSAIVTLAKDTPASDIDTVVNSLQNRYLGWGFNLSLSRHLSSAALGSLNATAPALSSGLSSLPFGARSTLQVSGGYLSRAPPPSVHRGGFAPPSSYSSYDPNQAGRGNAGTQVKISPPTDVKQLKLIHKTVEALLTHGPEFEALLMSRPEVQKDAKWSWIWNPRSPGGVWYRWRLWEILTGAYSQTRAANRGENPSHRVFDGSAMWVEPDEKLPFEFATHFEELISDPDYDSSDEDDSGDEGRPRRGTRQVDGASTPPRESVVHATIEDQSYLNPLQKAKLTHLLARLPSTTAKLRKGDVARVTAFAITHAGQGAEEVVEMLVDNVLHPFSKSRGANLDPKREELDDDVVRIDGPGKEKTDEHDKKETKDDNSHSVLVALHLISDILSASSTSGVRHSWRYRSLFESALASRKIFPYLGRMERELGWGRIRAEKWRRSVGSILQLWEGWCVFPASTQERFLEEFNRPPLTSEEEIAEAERRIKREGAKGSAKVKWKAVDVNAATERADAAGGSPDNMELDGEAAAGEAVDGEPMDDVDGEPMDDDLDGEPMDDDVDGVPMDDDIDGVPMEDNEVVNNLAPSPAPFGEEIPPSKNSATVERGSMRPKAEDMFADSDNE